MLQWRPWLPITWNGVRPRTFERWLRATPLLAFSLFNACRAEQTASSTAPHPSPERGADTGAAASAATDPPLPRSWVLGTWVGTGNARRTELSLPGNQGVQLGWLKDDAKAHSGPVRLTLHLTPDGAAEGRLEGALGSLRVMGNWQEEEPRALELRAEREGLDVFHGTLTLVWNRDERRGTAELRAVSGDGQWLRTASLELTPST